MGIFFLVKWIVEKEMYDVVKAAAVLQFEKGTDMAGAKKLLKQVCDVQFAKNAEGKPISDKAEIIKVGGE